MSLDIVMADDGIVFDGRVKDEKPLGGADTAFAELAEAFAARGHRVRAYSRCEAPLDWKGVRWSPVGDGLPDSADLYVANRSSKLILGCPRAKRALFWIHNPASYIRKPRYQWPLLLRRPTIVFLGPNHLSTYWWWGMGGKRVAIPYGIGAPFLGASEREPPPPRAVYFSSPLRNLDWLLEIWAERIHPNVPGGEFHIFGGPEVYGAVGVVKAPQMMKVFERAKQLAGRGVILRGSVGKRELAEECLRARAFLYRGHVGETFCNAAAEPQAMGVPGVVQDIACMAERVRDGVTGYVTHDDEGFAQAAIRVMTEDGLWRELHRNCLNLQRSWTWTDAAHAFERLAAPPPE